MDILYRRPYSDPEAKERLRSENKLLHLDLVITECCSLKCRNCSNLMQYYSSPCNLTSEDVINDIGTLLECISIGELKIIGGEPFVNQGVLTDVLQYLSENYTQKVDTINIITNGTIIPNEDCISTLAGIPRVIVTFSNYGNLSSHQEEFIKLCKQKGIRYSIIDDSFYWLDFGRPDKYDEPQEFVYRQYNNCYNRKNCNALYRGCLYVCPRQAHGIHLGMLPDINDEYVDLHASSYGNTDELRHSVIELVRRKTPISSCSYCIIGKYVHIPRAVQQRRSDPF